MLERVGESRQKPVEAPGATAGRLHADARSQADTQKPRSYLARGIDAVSSLVVSDQSTRAEVAHYATGFVKAVGLFARGRAGLAGTVAVYALDAMDPDTSIATQAVDGALGGSKGALLKGVLHGLGKKELPIATKGAVLGVASSAVETGLTRSTYIDPKTGSFDFGSGLDRVRETSLNRTSIIANAVIFTAAHGIFGGADNLSGGLIKKSPLLANMTNGFSFGMVSGAGTEIMGQQEAGGEIDIAGIAKKALIQGGVDSLAAIPGGVQSDAVFRQHAARSLESTYYSAKWKITEGQTEARRLTYVVLNKLNMRHPFQRLGDLIHGGDAAYAAPKPRLTAENNPIAAFETALPEYVRQMQEKERLLSEAREHEAKYAVHGSMGEVRTSFASKLLNMWHGTSERPGIASYTDAELATANTSAERVAEIRRALTLTAKAEYGSLSPLMQALSDLAPSSMRSEFGRNYEIAGELPAAKERFFGYNERELETRMAMPGHVYHKKRHFSTPKEWTPFAPTELLANLFHGSISHSLPSVFLERAMLPARELRLRGIEQHTGESAGQEFPRRAISITTDFDEAWAYTRHSPDFLTSYPIVYGISRNVIPRAWHAGMLEPGELLIQKLNVGESLWTRLGLTKPEVTHIYAPDSKVADINRLLSRYRLTGMRVVGLNELERPQWGS